MCLAAVVVDGFNRPMLKPPILERLVSVYVNSDGNTLAVGALWEDSNATGITHGADDSATGARAVYLY